jgi:hypothetical protein
MPTSNAQVESAISALSSYFSSYTGDELEAAIAEAKALMPFLDQNIVVPPAALTGDFARTTITTLSKDMWLESVTLRCITAFSASSKDIIYEVDADNAAIVSIPNNFMRATGDTLTYYINKLYPVGTVFSMVCSSTRAYGEVDVKLNFR